MNNFLPWLSPIRRSIFLKLLLIFFVTSMLAMSFMIYTFHKLQMSDAELQLRGKNRLLYARLLIEKMGTPPNPEMIQKLSVESFFKIRIEGPHFNYTLGDNVPSFEEAQKSSSQTFKESATTWVGRWGNSVVFSVDDPQARYLFIFPHDPLFEIRPDLAGVLTAVILFLFLATYLFTRWLISPLRELSQGVEEVSQGHLNYKVKVNKLDELGDLAESFNLMTARLQKIIKAKEQLLLDVSHDLRSPLTRINVALAVGGKEDLIRHNLQEMDAMLAGLLESARLDWDQDALRTKSSSLTKLLQDLVKTYGQEKPGVIWIGSESEVSARIDENLLRRALKNIIENALKFSLPESRPVEVALRQDGEQKLITIKDYGQGIAQEEQALVFEPFYRVDKSRSHQTPGYGLGLSFAKKIVQAHGGEITLQSVLGQGTTLQIRLR